MHPEVAGYIQRVPAEQRPHLEELRHLILGFFPDAEETFEHFPVYARGGTWLAGFASRKKGMMFYLMDPALLDAFEERLGPLRSGRSCVEYRASDDLTLKETRGLILELLAAAARSHSAHGV